MDEARRPPAGRRLVAQSCGLGNESLVRAANEGVNACRGLTRLFPPPMSRFTERPVRMPSIPLQFLDKVLDAEDRRGRCPWNRYEI